MTSCQFDMSNFCSATDQVHTLKAIKPQDLKLDIALLKRLCSESLWKADQSSVAYCGMFQGETNKWNLDSPNIVLVDWQIGSNFEKSSQYHWGTGSWSRDLQMHDLGTMPEANLQWFLWHLSGWCFKGVITRHLKGQDSTQKPVENHNGSIEFHVYAISNIFLSHKDSSNNKSAIKQLT